MSDFDSLIARLQKRVHSAQGSTDNAADYPAHRRQLSAPPLSHEEVAKAEVLLGFALPPLLSRLYSEVGNGGWGPGYGLVPLFHAVARESTFGEGTTTVVAQAQYFQTHEPKMAALLPINDWGCAIKSWVDTGHPDLPVVRCDPNLEHEVLNQVVRSVTGQEPEDNPYHFFDAWRECDSLYSWLQAWVEGADLWSRGYPAEWAEEE